MTFAGLFMAAALFFFVRKRMYVKNKGALTKFVEDGGENGGEGEGDEEGDEEKESGSGGQGEGVGEEGRGSGERGRSGQSRGRGVNGAASEEV